MLWDWRNSNADYFLFRISILFNMFFSEGFIQWKVTLVQVSPFSGFPLKLFHSASSHGSSPYLGNIHTMYLGPFRTNTHILVAQGARIDRFLNTAFHSYSPIFTVSHPYSRAASSLAQAETSPRSLNQREALDIQIRAYFQKYEKKEKKKIKLIEVRRLQIIEMTPDISAIAKALCLGGNRTLTHTHPSSHLFLWKKVWKHSAIKRVTLTLKGVKRLNTLR